MRYIAVLNNYYLSTHLLNRTKAIIVFVLLLLVPQLKVLHAQNTSKKLIIDYDNKTDTLEAFSSIGQVKYFLKEQQSSFLEEGYLSWSVDSVLEKEDYFKVRIYEGKSYKWNNLELAIAKGLALKSGINFENLSNTTLAIPVLLQKVEAVIQYYENNGYPFARVQMETFREKEAGIDAKFTIDPGVKVLFDTIAFHGNINISKKYIHQLLGITPQSTFSQQKLNNISKRIQSAPFLEQTRPAQIVFQNNKAIVHLYLKSKRANFFNGVIGVLPNTNVDPRLSSGNNLIITGDIQLKVFNTFGLGEKVKLNWRRLQALSQELELENDFNYLFGSPLGTSLDFNLVKQDTSFLNLENFLGLNYALSASKVITFFWEYQSTNVLSEQSSLNINPSLSNAYGAQIEWENLDYPFNPRKGFYFKASASLGTKETGGQKSEEEGFVLIDLPMEGNGLEVQRKVPVNSVIYRFRGLFDFYYPIGSISTLKSSFSGAWIENDYLFENELPRIGGFKQLRGFDEKSIFISHFAMLSLEYRLLLEQNSYFNLFF